jgi:hypothetical protein
MSKVSYGIILPWQQGPSPGVNNEDIYGKRSIKLRAFWLFSLPSSQGKYIDHKVEE